MSSSLVGAAVLVALLMFGGDGGYRVTATFENGGQLVVGNQVRVGGRPVGTIRAIELDARAQARVELGVDDTVAPPHRGTRATIRLRSDRAIGLRSSRREGLAAVLARSSIGLRSSRRCLSWSV